jgi:phage gp29-like protein
MALIASIVTAIQEALGRPAKAEALARSQTDTSDTRDANRAMLAALKRERAEHPSKGLTPAILYGILEDAEAGNLARQHALFADMEEKDPQIGSDLGKRKQAAAELEWQIEPPDQANRAERKAADQARELFGALEVEDLIIDLGDAIGHGWVNLELPWVRDGALRVIGQPVWRPHTWFQTPQDEFDTLSLRDGTIDGEPLWPLGWAQHRHRAKSGYVSRLGLHRSLVWPYLFQSYALGDLAELLEILGIPARLGKYPETASKDEKATLLAAVTQLGHSAAGIIPAGMAIEYLEAAKADGATHEVMLQWCERAKSKTILGGTLTTGEGQTSGSYAQAMVHERGLASLIQTDARQYASTIRRDILWPLAALNFGVTDLRRAPRWFLDTGATEDYKALSDSLPVFVDLGAKIPVWWLHEKTRIPQAEQGDEILRTAPAQSASPAALTAALRARSAAPDGQDLIDAEGARDPGYQAAMDILLRPILEAMDQGLTPEEILTHLPEWYGQLDDSALIALLDQGVAAAEAIGRLEVQDEAQPNA